MLYLGRTLHCSQNKIPHAPTKYLSFHTFFVVKMPSIQFSNPWWNTNYTLYMFNNIDFRLSFITMIVLSLVCIDTSAIVEPLTYETDCYATLPMYNGNYSGCTKKLHPK